MEVSTKFSIFNEFALCLNPYLTPFYPIPSMGCLLHDHQLQFSTGKCLFQKKIPLVYLEMKQKMKAGSYALCTDLCLSDIKILALP